MDYLLTYTAADDLLYKLVSFASNYILPAATILMRVQQRTFILKLHG